MQQFSKVLILEDRREDADLLEREAARSLPGAEFWRVALKAEFTTALREFKPDLILSDYQLPDFNGMEALALALEHDPEIPFFIITGSTNEETAVECIRAGAWNYILKDHLIGLGPALQAAAERSRLRQEHQQNMALLREREVRYRSLFNNNHTVMLIIDPESGLVIDANPAAAVYYGWSREQLAAMRVSEINTLNLEEIKQEMTRALSEQRRHFLSRHRLADGSVREVEVFSGPIEIEGRRLLYSIVHDISQRVKMQQELKKAYDHLKAAQSHLVQQEKMASIGLLAAGVAHEINNPVGFISSNLNTLRKYTRRLDEFCRRWQEWSPQGLEPACQQEMTRLAESLKIDHILADLPDLIEESLEGTQRVKEIVLSLKSFSRVDQSSQDMADINQCLEDTLRIVWNELKYQAKVTKDYGELPRIWCYPQQLNQVFLNLLTNAGQALEGQGEIGVRTWFADHEVHVMISDTGNGIAPGNLARLFDPFFTTKEVGKGTGLGLSISYDIVTRQHGGRLEVASTPGRGSTFTVHLPQLEAPVKEA